MNNDVKILADNLVYYRKASGYTQLEIAEKLNYSDKSISKWERGEGTPDIFVLRALSSLYGITLDDFFVVEKTKPVTNKKRKHWYIIGLSLAITFIVAALGFAIMMMINSDIFPWWLFFIYALLVSFIITTVFSSIWKRQEYQLISISGIIWSTCLAVFLTIQLTSPMEFTWLIFIAGIPVEILEVLWYFLRKNNRKKIMKEREEKM